MLRNPNSDDVFFRIPSPSNTSAFPNFAKPMELGHFSRDRHDQLRLDKSQLCSYSAPDSVTSLKLNLNDGYGQLIDYRDRLPGCLDNLLWWIKETHQCGAKSSSKCGGDCLKNAVGSADVVCWRGLLTNLSSSLYEQREGWMVGAVRFGGVVFLAEFETDSVKERNARLTEKDKRMMYWGHRFERYVTNGRSNDVNCVFDCNEQFCVIYRSKLGPSPADASCRQFRFVYGAETDCVDESGRYMELKTSRVIDNWRQERNFKRFKLLKWWLQSFLAGIDRIICGHRDDQGIVQFLKTYDVPVLPQLAASGGGEWSGAACMNFLYELLLFIDGQTGKPDQTDCVSDIAVFEFDPQSRLVRLVKTHSFTSNHVLPDWFVSAFGRV